ncbi:patatin-like phospholipase family protein [Clostridium sp. 'White wine YQ']|uniref:patatin-like phospholipase family protein n=1 Tax=Clostridium sp. 'White wine YQ' TaxID=3027474 RepID=UPI002366BF17|nr:patatin-like phospholipase family protein [Clostridium sp. 'White wine YQ']MDD7796380.1 patatin-like phospholipase family protein [Clostridium sp. 'White wine YQ']
MKIGLVFAGGGARGAYQIGVWKAFIELGIDKYISAVSGTSIGALNSVMFLSGNIELAERVWLNISKEKILPTSNFDLLKRGTLIAIGNKNMKFIKKYIPTVLEQGNISRSGLLEILDNYIDFDTILKNEKSCYVTCSKMPELTPRYFRLNDYDISTVKEILLATSAIPMIYESEEIHENRYLDGGMTDNTPIQPLYGEGCDIIIVVNLNKNFVIDRHLFPKTKIIEISPRNITDSVSETLDFNVPNIKRKIGEGYMETFELLEPIMEIANYKREQAPKETIINIGRDLLVKSKLIFNKKTLEKDDTTKNKEHING